MNAKSERFELRLDERTIEEVDNWRADQKDVPSRAEAIRRLVSDGLGKSSGEAVHFSDGEKLIVAMLCELFDKLKIGREFNTKLISKAISEGRTWALRWELQGVLHRHEDNYRNVGEVVDILDMWTFIEEGYEKLSPTAKKRIKGQADSFSDAKFRGFDGNNEAEHMGIATFLTEEMGRFTRFKGRDLNSHSHTLDRYHRMISAFKRMRPTLGMGKSMGETEIIELLNSGIAKG